MFVLKENKKEITEIKKSKFICLLYKLNNFDDIKIILDNIKKEYKDATHITYAYIFENKFKYYDDNEPSGTAGLPIYNILNKMELTNTLAIVVRYFGGIKLGVGGLSRAYSKTVKNTINKENLIPYKKQKHFFFETSYENEKLLNNILKKYTIINKTYKETIIVEALIDEEEIEIIKNSINNKIKMYE